LFYRKANLQAHLGTHKREKVFSLFQVICFERKSSSSFEISYMMGNSPFAVLSVLKAYLQDHLRVHSKKKVFG
jgi:hypothetical protein